MAFGIRFKDAAGNVTLDLSRNIARILGHVDTSGASGSVTDANLALGSPFFFSVPLAASDAYYSPQISIIGTTLSYDWTNPDYVVASRIFYGIF